VKSGVEHGQPQLVYKTNYINEDCKPRFYCIQTVLNVPVSKPSHTPKDAIFKYIENGFHHENQYFIYAT
jgi:hypothetical protein